MKNEEKTFTGSYHNESFHQGTKNRKSYTIYINDYNGKAEHKLNAEIRIKCTCIYYQKQFQGTHFLLL